MRDFVSKLLHKPVLVAFGSTLVVASALIAGVMTFAQPGQAAAASCTPSDPAPETNIIYCGIDQYPNGNPINNPDDMAKNLQAYFDGKQSDGHNSDIHAALAAGGLTDSMFTSGNGKWYITTSYDKDSNKTYSPNHSSIMLGTTVLATDLLIYSRCPSIPVNCKEEPQGYYHHVEGNVYWRDGNWFFDKNADGTLKHMNYILVHVNNNGVADFAVWTQCGNMIKFTPKVTSSLVCKVLTATPGNTTDTSIDYAFQVTATVQNTPNITYTINFGDGSQTESKSVTDGTASVSFAHTYTRLDTDKVYTASAQVNGQTQVPTCQTPVHITAKKQLTFACQALNANASNVSNGSVTYTFTATTTTGTGTDTTKNYQFFFGDNSQTDAQTSNTATHTYTFDAGTTPTFTAHFVATSTTGMTTDQNDKNCQFSFTPKMPETGPAGVAGLMAGTSFLGFGIHQLLIRRKLLA